MNWWKSLRERLFMPRSDADSIAPDEHSELDWLKRFHEPLFQSRKDAESYVIRELGQALPEDWRVNRIPGEELRWSIVKQRPEPGEWPNQSYDVSISSGLDVVILTHGNNDAGCFGLHHALRNAVVIETGYLRKYSLGECMPFLFANCKPDEWGYT